MPRPRHALRRGFTLVELTIVVLLTGILAAVASPAFSGALARNRVDAVANRLVADLNFARRYAMSSSANVEVQFFSTPSIGYRVPAVPDPDHRSEGYEVVVSDTIGGITGVTANFDGATKFTFDIHGQPFAGTPLEALGEGSVVIQSGSEVRNVVVDSVTGEASVQ